MFLKKQVIMFPLLSLSFQHLPFYYATMAVINTSALFPPLKAKQIIQCFWKEKLLSIILYY